MLDARFSECVRALWQLRLPADANLYNAPQFISLSQVCRDLFPNLGRPIAFNFALMDALRSLGLPVQRSQADRAISLDEATATMHLHENLAEPNVSRTYLCPLNLADDLPPIEFGPNEVRTFKKAELEALIDLERLRRFNPQWTFDTGRLSEFTWLVVREKFPRGDSPRTKLGMDDWDVTADWGAIIPHKDHFPAAVEAALLALLMAPWEDWSQYPEVDTFAFRVPWVYPIDKDLLVRPSAPPDPDTLTWRLASGTNQYGETDEFEVPQQHDLGPEVSFLSEYVNTDRWNDLQRAVCSPLFVTPIKHFFVRAFHASGIDEVLAHMMAIEAAVGIKADYPRKGDPPRRHRNLGGAKERVAARIAGLLGSRSDGRDYGDLFEVRSEYLHGRPMSAISTENRILARRLSRKVVAGLVEVAARIGSSQTRDEVLDDLLDSGVALPAT